MVKFIAYRIAWIWLMMVLLIGVAHIFINAEPPALQRVTQVSCDENAATLWDRQHRLNVSITIPQYCVLSAVWSPDGQQIAIAQYPNRGGSGGILPPQLIVISLNQSDVRVVRNSGAFDHERERFYETRIQWSPDGQWIMYTVRPGANDLHLWVVRADGSAIYDYSHFIEHEPAVFFWSADSQYVYLRMVEFDATSQAIHRLKLPLAPNPEPVAPPPEPIDTTVWVYPTVRGGEMLAFTENGLWLVNLDTDESQLLADTQLWDYVGNVDMRWSADSEWLALLGATRNYHTILQMIRRDGSEIREYYMVADTDSHRRWFITDFDYPRNIRVITPDWAGFICDIDLQTHENRCHIGQDSRRIMARPIQ